MPPHFDAPADWRVIYYFLTCPDDETLRLWDEIFTEIASVGSCVTISETNSPPSNENITPHVHVLAQYEQLEKNGNAAHQMLRRYYLMPSSKRACTSMPTTTRDLVSSGWAEDVPLDVDIRRRLTTYFNWCNDHFPARHTAVYFLGHGSGTLGLLYSVLRMLETGYPVDIELVRKLLNLLQIEFDFISPLGIDKEKVTDKLLEFLQTDQAERLIATENAYGTTVFSGKGRESLSITDLGRIFSETLTGAGRKVDIIGFNSCSMLNFENAYELSFCGCKYLYAFPASQMVSFPHRMWLSWLYSGSRTILGRFPGMNPISPERFLKAAFQMEVMNKLPASNFACCASGVVKTANSQIVGEKLNAFADEVLKLFEIIDSCNSTDLDRREAKHQVQILQDLRFSSRLYIAKDRDLLGFLGPVSEHRELRQTLRDAAVLATESIKNAFLHHDTGIISTSRQLVAYDFCNQIRNTQDPDAVSLSVFFPSRSSAALQSYRSANLRAVEDLAWLNMVERLF